MYKTIEENKDLLKFNAEGVHPADQFLNAREVAIKAVDDYMIGKEEPMYCGFANVSIHPAKGSFVSFMKKASIGDTGSEADTEYLIMILCQQTTNMLEHQSLDIKEIATEAFRDELRKYGLTVYAESRAD